METSKSIITNTTSRCDHDGTLFRHNQRNSNYTSVFDNWLIPGSLFIRDGLVTDVEATVGTYDIRSYGGE